jgi:uncharacterized protein YdaU (DUF1376 family)
MHYYAFNPSDYLAHTMHLSPMEDLAYRRMLDWCYIHERDLPDDVDRIARIIQMPDSCNCIAFVLEEYFTKVKNGWSHKRVREEIKKYRETSKKRQGAASARWQREKGNANALQVHSKRNANQEPRTINQEPLTKNQSITTTLPQGDNPPRCPYSEIQNLYNDILARPGTHGYSLPKSEVLSESIKGHMRQRWQDRKTGLCDLEAWEVFFVYVRDYCPFLMGASTPAPGRKVFRADLAWLIKADNYRKIYEKKYEGAF